MKLATELFLLVMVAAAWLGSLGFVRLRTPLDRIHCVTFVNVVCGIALLAAALLSDGLSDRVLKILLIVGLNLVSGSAISHMTGRAIMLRENKP